MSSDTLENETAAEVDKPEFDRDSTANTIKVAVQLCLVCSIIVSFCAVYLRPFQEANKKAFEQENILKAAGLYEEGSDLETVFKKVTPRIVDLNTGSYADDIDIESFDTAKAAREGTPPINDIARVKRREAFAKIYEVDNEIDGKQIILPIRGYGLWSTLYGFIALDVSEIEGGLDKVKVKGLSYYKHGETPGLGGEVDNPNWKAKWPGKQLFDSDGNVVIQVAKAAKGDTQVDALSGATITSKGVTNMLQFWLGSEGYGPFLKTLQNK